MFTAFQNVVTYTQLNFLMSKISDDQKIHLKKHCGFVLIPDILTWVIFKGTTWIKEQFIDAPVFQVVMVCHSTALTHTVEPSAPIVQNEMDVITMPSKSSLSFSIYIFLLIKIFFFENKFITGFQNTIQNQASFVHLKDTPKLRAKYTLFQLAL